MLCLAKIKCMFFELFSKLIFPRRNYIPKEATQQNVFLTKYPEFDGRGIKIAIIDSGVDVSFEGMQKTSEGLPKIIDCFDFTGSGDVDTSSIRKTDSEGILIGLSGRKFKIPQKWINPSGEWHLGLKSFYKPKIPVSKTKTWGEKLPEIDCIVWHDGTKWHACIQTLTKNLENAKVLTNFRDEHDYGNITLNRIKINYCITVHNDGNLLEIFTANDYHGSIVAEVAAAAYTTSQTREGDGLAPGAQIISMNVLDPGNNLNLSESALHKALIKCIEMKVDIIVYTMSFFTTYNEVTDLTEAISNLIIEMVIKHNILIFKSAGNHGPFFHTIPKSGRRTEDVIFRIGAILTSDIRKRHYNVPAEINYPPIVYPYSSKGPCENIMDPGLDFMAPGGFISSCFGIRDLYGSGTSFSSPNAAGAVACLLSGLKIREIQYSHSSIKFILRKTALFPETQNQFAFGHGIIQIDDAFDYCCKNNNIHNFKIPTALSPSIKAKGICFWQNDEGKGVLEKREVDLSHFIDIAPGNAAAEKWTLECSTKAKNYIEISQKINEDNFFIVEVDSRKLESGTPYFAEISIIDHLYGSIFSIPIMMIYYLSITESRNSHIEREISLNYETPHYIYFHPVFENNITMKKKCEIKIFFVSKNQASKLCIEYNVHDETRSNMILRRETKKTLKFSSWNRTGEYSFPIENTKIHEVCIYQQTGFSASNANFKLELEFKDDDDQKRKEF